jgi:hypothetical protein
MVGRMGSWGCPCAEGTVWGGYGEGEGTTALAPTSSQTPPASDGSAYYTDFAKKTTEIFAPLVGQLTDPIRQMEVLRVQILNAKVRGASPQSIALLEARYRAAERQAGMRVEGERASREWRIVGQLGVVSGIVVAGAVTLWILSRIFSGR